MECGIIAGRKKERNGYGKECDNRNLVPSGGGACRRLRVAAHQLPAPAGGYRRPGAGSEQDAQAIRTKFDWSDDTTANIEKAAKNSFRDAFNKYIDGLESTELLRKIDE